MQSTSQILNILQDRYKPFLSEKQTIRRPVFDVYIKILYSFYSKPHFCHHYKYSTHVCIIKFYVPSNLWCGGGGWATLIFTWLFRVYTLQTSSKRTAIYMNSILWKRDSFIVVIISCEQRWYRCVVFCIGKFEKEILLHRGDSWVKKCSQLLMLALKEF